MSAYVGWITQDEAEALAELVDELAVHAYRPGPEDAFEYVKERLSYFDGIHMPIRPIFSAEPDFMGSWLEANGLERAEHILNTGYDEWTGTAKPLFRSGGSYIFAIPNSEAGWRSLHASKASSGHQLLHGSSRAFNFIRDAHNLYTTVGFWEIYASMTDGPNSRTFRVWAFMAWLARAGRRFDRSVSRLLRSGGRNSLPNLYCLDILNMTERSNQLSRLLPFGQWVLVGGSGPHRQRKSS